MIVTIAQEDDQHDEDKWNNKGTGQTLVGTTKEKLQPFLVAWSLALQMWLGIQTGMHTKDQNFS